MCPSCLSCLFHTTSNHVSPTTIQEILDTMDPALIDEACHQLDVEGMTRYLMSLFSTPSPSGMVGTVSPEKVGAPSSGFVTPSSRARRPHRGSIRLSSRARTAHKGSPRISLRRASTPRGHLTSLTFAIAPLVSTLCIPTSRPSWFSSMLSQAELQHQLCMLLQDQQQIVAGRCIANITTTNSIVTSYKEGGCPTIQSNSLQYSF